MGSKITKGVRAGIELNPEKLTFLTETGETHSIVLKDLLDGEDNTNAALAYANLIVLQNMAERQADLAQAMNDLAQAIRGVVPAQGSAAFTPDAVDGLVDSMFKRMTGLFAAAGMKLPNAGG